MAGKILFSIRCETCQALLHVRNEAAIGAILACPKCGSMVHVVPPASPAETAGKTEPQAPPKQPQAGKSTPSAKSAKADRSKLPPAASQRRAGVSATGAGGTLAQPDSSPKAQVPTGAEPAVADQPIAQAEPGAGSGSGQVVAYKPHPTQLQEPLAAKPAWYRQPLAWGAALAFAGVIAAGVWIIVAKRSTPAPQPEQKQTASTTAEQSPSKQPQATPPEESVNPLEDRLAWIVPWLPKEVKLAAVWQLPERASPELLEQLAASTVRSVAVSVATAARAFGVDATALAQVVWIETDWSNSDPELLLLRFRPGHDATVLTALGEPVEKTASDLSLFRLKKGNWQFPFVVPDESLLVTGKLEALEARVGSAGLAAVDSSVFRTLWEQLPHEERLFLAADLRNVPEPLRTAPARWLEAWPQIERHSYLLCKLPVGIGLGTANTPSSKPTVALVCDSQATAEQLRQVLEQSLPVVQGLLSSQSKLAEETNNKEAAAAASLFGQLKQLAATARWEVVDQIVWVRFGESTDPLQLVLQASVGQRYVQAWRLSAGEQLVRNRYDDLAAALRQFEQREGSLPPGAGGAALLPPETRLSWLAILLPYMQHEDWFKELQFGYSWNSAQNKPITSRPLPEVLNPLIGRRTTEGGFPVTHVVGVAGVGPDAAELPAGHPRAGVFGYSRRTRLDQLPDGASHTIALLGVSDKLGPWASGGPATVRALTTRPYVDGPDGFGSGLPDGMLAAMADGSVRFIGKDVDPVVLEQLAAAGDGAPADLTAIIAAEKAREPLAKLLPEIEQEPILPLPESRPSEITEPTVVQQPTPEQSPAPQRREIPPGQIPIIDPQKALAMKLGAIRIPNIPLIKAVRTLSSISAVPISFDMEALQLFGHSVAQKVRVDLEENTLQAALARMLEQCNLSYVTEREHVIITVPEPLRTDLRTVEYDVSDLVANSPEQTRQLLEWIRLLVSPEQWQENGGRGTMRLDAGRLTVVQAPLVQQQVAWFLERLRIARGLPRKLNLPFNVSLKTRFSLAKAALVRPVTINFFDGGRLRQILRDLEELTGFTIVVDQRALWQANISLEESARIVAQDKPLMIVLDELLLPLGLAWYPVDAVTLVVTTRNTAAQKLQLEFYPVADLLQSDFAVEARRSASQDGDSTAIDAAALIERLKTELQVDNWSDAGGPAQIVFDKKSQHLLVLQSPLVHIELETLLDRWRQQRQSKDQGSAQQSTSNPTGLPPAEK